VLAPFGAAFGLAFGLVEGCGRGCRPPATERLASLAGPTPVMPDVGGFVKKLLLLILIVALGALASKKLKSS
jgi:hypothetical protein